MSKSTGKLKNIVFENYTNNAGRSIELLEAVVLTSVDFSLLAR